MLVNCVAVDEATITNNVAATAAYQVVLVNKRNQYRYFTSSKPNTAVTKMLTTTQALKAQVKICQINLLTGSIAVIEA